MNSGALKCLNVFFIKKFYKKPRQTNVLNQNQIVCAKHTRIRMQISANPNTVVENLVVATFLSAVVRFIQRRELLDIHRGVTDQQPAQTLMTFELKIKCPCQHAATGNHLEVKTISWGDFEKPIVVTIKLLRQTKLGIRKPPINQGTKALTNNLSAFVEFKRLPHFKRDHPVQRHPVRENVLCLQILYSSSVQTSLKRIKFIY